MQRKSLNQVAVAAPALALTRHPWGAALSHCAKENSPASLQGEKLPGPELHPRLISSTSTCPAPTPENGTEQDPVGLPEDRPPHVPHLLFVEKL